MYHVVSVTKPRLTNSMSPGEIGQHRREITLHCIRTARESTDARVARELEIASIVLADRASSLATIVTVSSGRNEFPGLKGIAIVVCRLCKTGPLFRSAFMFSARKAQYGCK
jgi:hypothetical protein